VCLVLYRGLANLFQRQSQVPGGGTGLQVIGARGVESFVGPQSAPADGGCERLDQCPRGRALRAVGPVPLRAGTASAWTSAPVDGRCERLTSAPVDGGCERLPENGVHKKAIYRRQSIVFGCIASGECPRRVADDPIVPRRVPV
jgi:hypothetical protein